MEFSKLLFWLAFLIALGVTVFGCVLMWHTGDTSGLVYLIPAAFTELATATGFYYNKAKAENRIKLMRQNGVKIDKDTFEP